jgi:hypothetical protein
VSWLLLGSQTPVHPPQLTSLSSQHWAEGGHGKGLTLTYQDPHEASCTPGSLWPLLHVGIGSASHLNGQGASKQSMALQGHTAHRIPQGPGDPLPNSHLYTSSLIPWPVCSTITRGARGSSP